MAIDKIHITNDALTTGKTLTLDMFTSNDDEGIIIYNLEGLGPPDATLNTVGGPNFPGAHLNSVHKGVRTVTLTLAVINPRTGSNNETLAMREIYEHFPIGDPVELRVESTLADVISNMYVEKLEMNQFAKVVNAVATLQAPVPWWESNTSWTRSFSTSGQAHTYGSIVPAGGLITINYTGTHGSDITLTNSIDSQSMTIDYTYLPSGVTPPVNGDKIEIDTRDGQKSCRFWDNSQSAWFNAMSALSVDDDWIKMKYGSNVLTYDCSIASDESDMTASIFHREYYQGV